MQDPHPPPAVLDARGDLTSLARGGLINLVGVLTSTTFSFLLVVIVTRGLGQASTGIFFESIAFFNIAMAIAGWGADVGAIRTIPRYRQLGSRQDVRHSIEAALLPVIAVGSICAVLLFGFADQLGAWLANEAHGDALAASFRILAPFLPLAAAYMVSLAVTRGFGTMLPTTLIDKVGRASLQALLVLVVVSAGLSAAAVSVAWAVPFALGLGAALVWGRRLVRAYVRPVEGGDGSNLGRSRVYRDFWRFTTPRGLASMFSVVILWSGTLVIGAMRSPAEAGVYAAATRYLAFGQFVGVAIAQVVGPKMSEVLARGDRLRARTVYATATWWLMGLAWPIYLVMAFMSPSLVTVFGPGFGEAAPVLAILGATMLVATFVGPVDMVLLMAGKSSWNLWNTVAAVIANLALNLLLVPRFGVIGAAVAMSASILINNLLPLAQVWRTEGLHPFGIGSAVVGAAALLSVGTVSLVVRAVLEPGIGAVVVAALLATPIYLALLWRWRDALHLAALRAAIRRTGTEEPERAAMDPLGTR
jgi:O-antigen/teichoic acid export membrane protein